MTHKKLFRVLALAAIVAMAAITPLQAGEGCQKKGDPEKMMGKGCAMGHGCMMLKAIPSLSDEQKGKLEKLHAEHLEIMVAAKAEMEKQALEMKALMKDPVDSKKIEAKIDEIAKMKADMQKKCLVHRLGVRALLTDEQKAKLGEMGCAGMGCGMMMHGQGCMMGGCRMHMKGCRMKHGQEMKKAGCPKTVEAKK
jgi:Spy/CpxP family protein refolding chaperone